MKNISLLITLIALTVFKANASNFLYDCNSPRPEMSGHHNMVLFGDPDDKIYTYHLPLFTGEVNGQSMHVFMHIYQGIWDVHLDDATMLGYKNKFLLEKSYINPFPFFSISPRGQRFKVPEMICNSSFKTEVVSVYGHVEGNPNFPSPEPLVNQLSVLKVNRTVFARRFDGESKDQLTYIVFGTNKQLYLAHYLTDDENSFDQIVAVDIEDGDLKQSALSGRLTLLTLPIDLNGNLTTIFGVIGKNNKFALPTQPLGQFVNGTFRGKSYKIKINGEIYFNNNADLRVSY